MVCGGNSQLSMIFKLDPMINWTQCYKRAEETMVVFEL